ncbi:MAG: iron-containing alcohol dehydrogenase [Ignavibacteria bacterium]|jgi:alcohol dehydrogenase|nr:iron-containing alcohol dehydrogenase [Ignavibacteria bacterium]MCU7502865.1 iron-containing alcohol dehydrogenase [Ignavibacteria bacterium]MCU7515641.1 iron-containing alcohol dehydrogenase [Ignavibacteria bacterium]
MNFQYFIPTKILFGAGMLDKLSTEKLPGKKALIVISGGSSMKKYGYLDRVVELLKRNGTEAVVFDRILPNPIRRHVMEGAAMAKENNCDFILGLGGGSSIDSAKSIAVMVKNPGDYWDYINGGSGKSKPVLNGALPIVAVTTTAGTGTEADPWSVITHEERNEKIGFGTPDTFPCLSIVDPELMISIPPHLTAYQGFDAFFHAAEGFIAKTATPLSDILALRSIGLLSQYLPAAVKNGNNLEARTNVALANTLSGMVESTSNCTSEHSMEHALSALHPELPHGAGLIMLSVSYFSFFMKHVPEKLSQMADAMGRDIKGLTAEEGACRFIEALKELQEVCGVSELKMSQFGIKASEMETAAKNARETMGKLFAVDPYPLSFQETVSIIKNAYK